MTALITGASAGLGAEFARQLASSGNGLVLVARSEDRLRVLAAELGAAYGVPTEVLVADLESEEGLRAVEVRLAADAHPIDLLVNNAGYGLKGDFHDNSAEQEQAQLDILVTAVLRLSHTAIRAMTARGGGRILNVASAAGFFPGGTYSAAKAWVIAFSRWANASYGRGRARVRVTALCPGFVRTEFHERMGVTTRRIPGFAWLRPAPVVAAGLRASRRGRSVCVPSLRYKAAVAITKLVPPNLLTGNGNLWREG